jgi:ABC-2 type transport system ATP-binding protein
MCARPAHGNIIAMTQARELTKQVGCDMFVRTPRRNGLSRVLTAMGATVRGEPGHGLSVTGMDACTIASAAAAHYIPIQQLTPRTASVEESCSRSTGMSCTRQRSGLTMLGFISEGHAGCPPW